MDFELFPQQFRVNQSIGQSGSTLNVPTLIAKAGDRATLRFIEFFIAHSQVGWNDLSELPHRSAGLEQQSKLAFLQ